MKNANFPIAFIFILLATFMSSCEAIGGIFKAGMGFGIFVVLAVVVLIVGLIVKMGKK
ncbi:MAG TPA: hypothetical protein PKD91_01290 [Bacteroidia bacterium]|nr:hypothetical protein [Bacteroidia bacterium]